MDDDIKVQFNQADQEFFIYFNQKKILEFLQNYKRQIIENRNEDYHFHLLYEQLLHIETIEAKIQFNKESQINYFQLANYLFPNASKLTLNLNELDKLRQDEIIEIGQFINKQQKLNELDIILDRCFEKEQIQVFFEKIFSNQKDMKKISICCLQSKNKEGNEIINAIQIINQAQNLKQLSLRFKQTKENNLYLVKLGESVISLNKLIGLCLKIEKEENFIGDGTIHLFQMISKKIYLLQLSIDVFDQANIQKELLNQIYQCTRVLLNLTKFDYTIQGQSIDTESACIIGDTLQGPLHIQDLILEIHSIQQNQRVTLFSPIQGNLFLGLAGLQSLSLCIYNNKMQEDGYNFIGKSLVRIPNLKKLILKIKSQNHQIQNNFLSEFLSQSHQLQNLELQIDDQINEQTLESLGNCLYNLCNINFIKLRILPTFRSTQSLEKLVSSFKPLKQLKEIFLQIFVYVSKYSIVTSIQQRNQLKKLIHQQLINSIRDLPNLLSLNFKFDETTFSKSRILIKQSKKIVSIY
ncbi:hypothetical protein ABPG72_000390 [Tetrahymena utriculariae]